VVVNESGDFARALAPRDRFQRPSAERRIRNAFCGSATRIVRSIVILTVSPPVVEYASPIAVSACATLGGSGCAGSLSARSACAASARSRASDHRSLELGVAGVRRRLPRREARAQQRIAQAGIELGAHRRAGAGDLDAAAEPGAGAAA
jgi:hypothetical protein